MKKLLIALAMVAFYFSTAVAQTTPVKAKKVVTVKANANVKKVEVKNGAGATASKTTIKTSNTQKVNTGVKLKADGTPDKRYKAKGNVGPVKKDGTPDMRYKGNKKN